MSMTKRAAAAVLAGAIAITACGSDGGEDSSVASPVETAADADSEAAVQNPLLTGTVSTVTGSQIDLAGFEGKDVLLWVWAPW